MEPAAKQKVIYITYLIAALDITWLFLQFSITPYLARRLGFDTIWFGYLQTTVGVIQLLGGPIYGRFADVFGARAALSVSCLASVVYFLLLAVADNTFMLFVHKLPAVFMHALPGAQMVVADLSENEKRADALGKLGLCFGIGMIAGSSLGGTLKSDYCILLNGVCIYLFQHYNSFMYYYKYNFYQKYIYNDYYDFYVCLEKGSSNSVFNLGEITRLMKFPGVAKTFTVKIISGLPAGIFQVMFSIIAINFFQLKAEQNGYLMAYFGIVQMVIQGAVIGRLTSRFSESSLMLLSVGISSLVGLAQAMMTNVFHFCLIVIPMMFSLSVFNVITDSMLTKSVSPSDTGTMLGLCASVQSLLRTVGPTIGGFLYEAYGVPSFGYIQCIINAAVFSFLLTTGGRSQPNRP
uniref:Organic cation transporter-like protein 2 n=1 Tax=Sinocyclocheilus rhinocerous TaxID=307959 RepID=A0A673LCP6_9TELE